MLAAAAAGLEEEETEEEKEEAEVGTAAGARPEAGLQPGMLSSPSARVPSRPLETTLPDTLAPAPPLGPDPNSEGRVARAAFARPPTAQVRPVRPGLAQGAAWPPPAPPRPWPHRRGPGPAPSPLPPGAPSRSGQPDARGWANGGGPASRADRGVGRPGRHAPLLSQPSRPRRSRG